MYYDAAKILNFCLITKLSCYFFRIKQKFNSCLEKKRDFS